jgi:hypothetical protein
MNPLQADLQCQSFDVSLSRPNGAKRCNVQQIEKTFQDFLNRQKNQVLFPQRYFRAIFQTIRTHAKASHNVETQDFQPQDAIVHCDNLLIKTNS